MSPLFRPGMLYTARETCERLGVGQQTLRNWRKNKGLPTIQIGYAIRFNGADLNKWLADREKVNR